jgi:hypothetical protein
MQQTRILELIYYCEIWVIQKCVVGEYTSTIVRFHYVLLPVPKIAGSNPAEAIGFFGRKNPQYAFLRSGSKAVCSM